MRCHPPIIPKYDSKAFHLLKGSYPSPNIKGWQMVIPQHIIMLDPNLENGSQDFVSLTPNEVRILFLIILMREGVAHIRDMGEFETSIY